MAQVFWLVVGLGRLIKGGDLFVSAALRIAEFLRMPRVVVGSTLVSLATTTPELVVSIMAGGKGESGLAVGNAIGSCICNIGWILGVMAAFRNVEVHPKALRIPLTANRHQPSRCAYALFGLDHSVTLAAVAPIVPSFHLGVGRSLLSGGGG